MLILQLADKPHFQIVSKCDELFPADPLTNIRPWHQIEQKIYFPGRAGCLFKAKITQINLPRAVESE
jgi:hypothetical protein